MTILRVILQALCCAVFGVSLMWACAFDDSLREYLNLQFWFPFAKGGRHFAKPNVQRVSAPYAGMEQALAAMPLSDLRLAYQTIAAPNSPLYDFGSLQKALAAARSVRSLTPREQEEVALLDAKVDMRAGSPERVELLHRAKKKLQAFLRKARTPEYLSEVRGWLAYVHLLLGQQTAAGKIYLDELNRKGSNLSYETLVNSLRLTYGYDGGDELLDHLDEYFDTPEHAAFAIHLVTNPHWPKKDSPLRGDPELGPVVTAPPPYARIMSLLERHRELLQSETGANTLALLSMRTALRAADPAAARRIAAAVSKQAAIRADPDFNWMLASSHFLARDYRAAEQPLLRLFRSSRASPISRLRRRMAFVVCI